MKLALFLVLLCLAQTGRAVEFSYYGDVYVVDTIEDKYFVYPKIVTARAIEISTFSPNDCDLLEQKIRDKEKNFYICQDRPHSFFCQLLMQDLLFQSKEENFQSPVELRSLERSWMIEPKALLTEESHLKNFAANFLGLSETEIIVQLKHPFNLSPTVSLEKQESSLLSRVTKIVPIADGALEPLKIVNGKLKINNRFFACDLANKSVVIKSEIRTHIKYTKKIAEEDLKSLWVMYNNLKRFLDSEKIKNSPLLLRAAFIGREIGLELESSSLDRNCFDLNKILQNLFIISEFNIEPKTFLTKEHLRESEFPDKHLYKSVTITGIIK